MDNEISKELLKEITQEYKDVDENDEEDYSSKSLSLVTVVSYTPLPIGPEISYERDNDFTTQTFRVKSEVQAGHVSGHYLVIRRGRVSADSPRNDDARFKIHVFYDEQQKQDLWIFESARDPGKVIAIINDKVTIQNVQSSHFTSITHVQASHPEILFLKKPIKAGSGVFTLRLAGVTGTYYLGFDKTNGSAMTPSNVRPSQKEAKFRIF